MKFNQYVFCVKCMIHNYVTVMRNYVMYRLGTQLSHIEATEGITIRWTPESDPFQDYLSQDSRRERAITGEHGSNSKGKVVSPQTQSQVCWYVCTYTLCMHTCTVSHSNSN